MNPLGTQQFGTGSICEAISYRRVGRQAGRHARTQTHRRARQTQQPRATECPSHQCEQRRGDSAAEQPGGLGGVCFCAGSGSTGHVAVTGAQAQPNTLYAKPSVARFGAVSIGVEFAHENRHLTKREFFKHPPLQESLTFREFNPNAFFSVSVFNAIRET